MQIIRNMIYPELNLHAFEKNKITIGEWTIKLREVQTNIYNNLS